jgi:hypothetical protein
MLRPQRNTQLPSRYKSSSPPRLQKANNQPKRRRIDPEIVDRNDVDLALAVMAPAPECGDESLTLIPTELPHFVANYVQNRSGHSQHTNLSESGFFKLFFDDLMMEILSIEINSYAEIHRNHPSQVLHENYH